MGYRVNNYSMIRCYLSRQRNQSDGHTAGCFQRKLQLGAAVHLALLYLHLRAGRDGLVTVGVDFGHVLLSGRQEVQPDSHPSSLVVGDASHEPLFAMTAGRRDVLPYLTIQHARIVPDNIDIVEELQFGFVLRIRRLVVPVHVLQRAVVDHGEGQLMGRRSLNGTRTGYSVAVALLLHTTEVLTVVADGVVGSTGHSFNGRSW